MNTRDCIIKYRRMDQSKMEQWKENRIRTIHKSLPIIMELRDSSIKEEDFERYTRNYNNLLEELLRLTSRP